MGFLSAALAACMPAHGWQRTDRRACAPESPAVLCLSAASEGPYELRVGERVLLPGECLVAPSADDRGRVHLTLHASGEPVDRPGVRARPGVRTELQVTEGRRGPRLAVIERQACDHRVPEPSL